MATNDNIENQPIKIPFYDSKTKGFNSRELASSGMKDNVFLETEEELIPKFIEQGMNEETARLNYSQIKGDYDNLKLGIFDEGGPANMETPSTVWDVMNIGQTSQDQIKSTQFLKLPKETGIASVYNDYTYLDESKYVTTNKDGKKEVNELTALNRIFNPRLVIRKDTDEYGNQVGKSYIAEMEDWNTNAKENPYLAFASPKVYGHTAVFDELNSFLSGMVVQGVLGTAGNLISITGELLEWGAEKGIDALSYGGVVDDKETVKGAIDEYNPITFLGDMLGNYSSRWKFQASDELMEDGFTGSLASFSVNTAEGIGEFVPQLIAAFYSGGGSVFGTTAAKIGAKQAIKASGKKLAQKELTKAAAEKTLIKTMKGRGMNATRAFASVGTAQGMSGLYQDLRSNGIEGPTAAGLALTAAPIIWATEVFTAGVWMKGPLGINSFDKVVSESIQESIGKMSKNGLRKLTTDEGMNSFKKQFGISMIKNTAKAFRKGPKAIYKEAVNASRAAASDISGLAKKNIGRFGGLVTTPVNVTKGIWNGLGVVEASMANKLFNPATAVKGAIGEGIQELLEQISYHHIYYAHDNLLADKQSIPGKGMMGYRSYKNDVWGRKAKEALKESFIGGASIGGFTTGFIRSRNKGITKDNYLAMAAYNNQISSVIESMTKQRDELFGSYEMDPDYNVLTNNETDNVAEVVAEDVSYFNGRAEVKLFEKGQELKSMNDVNYYHAVLDAQMAELLVKEQGFDPANVQMFAGQEGILFRAFDKFKEIKETKSRIESIQAEFESDEITPEKRTGLETELIKLENELEEHKANYNYLVAPDNTRNKLSNNIKNANEEINTIDSQLNSGELNDANISLAQSKIDSLKDIVENPSSTDEEKSEANKSIAELNRKISSGKLSNEDINTLRDAKALLQNQIKSFELQHSKTNANNGYSLAYKDTIKNSLALMSFANKKAAEVLKLKDKYSEFTEMEIKDMSKEDVQQFMSIRNSIITGMNSKNIYDNVKLIEQEIDKVLLKRKEQHALYESDQQIISDEALKSKNIINDLKSILGRTTNIDEAVKDVESLSLFSDLEKSINDLISVDIGGTFGLSSEIDNDFKEVSDLLNEYIATQEDLLLDYELEGFEGLEPQTVEAFKGAKSLFSKSKIALDRFTEQQVSSLGFETEINRQRGLTDDQLREEIMLTSIQETLDQLDKSKDNDYSDQNLISLNRQLEEQFNQLEMFDNVIDIRSNVFNPLQDSTDRKYLDPVDRIISDKDYSRLKKEMAELSVRTNEHLKAVEAMVGSQSNYLTYERIGQSQMNLHALTILSDNSDTTPFINKDELDKELGLLTDLIPDVNDPSEINDKHRTDLVNVETRIRNIFNKIWHNRESLTIDSVLTSLLENSFITSDSIGNRGRRYNMDSEYDNHSKTTIIQNTIAYSNYVNTSSWENTIGARAGYNHFVNTLIKLTSDVSPSQIDEKRVEVYGDETIASSSEQINAENEAVAYLFGGSNTFEKIRSIEYELNKKHLGEIRQESFAHKYRKNSLLIEGEVQTGKTMQVSKQIIKLATALKEDSKFILVSFSEDSKANFDELINQLGPEYSNNIEISSKDDILNKTIDITNKTVIWDESTLLNETELKNASELAVDGNSMIVYLGDASQMQTIVGEQASPIIEVNHVGFKTTALTKKFATDNPLLSSLMEHSKSNINTLEKTPMPKWYFEETKGIRRGTKYALNIDEVITDFIDRRIELADQKDISLVFLSEDQFNDWTKKRPEIKQHKDFVTVLSVDPLKKGIIESIQGGRRQEIYIAYDGSIEETEPYLGKGMNGLANKMGKKAIYTLLGRASSFVTLPGDVNNQYSSKPNNFTAERIDVDFQKLKEETTSWLTSINKLDPSKLQKPIKVTPTSTDPLITEQQKESLRLLNNIATNELLEEITDEGIRKFRKRGTTAVFNSITTVVGESDQSILSKKKNTIFRTDNLNKSKDLFRVENSSKIGITLDRIMRDFFNGELKKYTDYTTDLTNEQQEVNTINVFAKESAYNEYIEYLESIKQDINANGEIPFTKNTRFIYEGSELVTGEPDLITIKRDGTLKVYDLKSKFLRKDDDEIDDAIYREREYLDGGNDFEKESRQVNGYRALIGNDSRLNGELQVSELALVYFGYKPFSNIKNIRIITSPSIIPVDFKETNIDVIIRNDKLDKSINESPEEILEYKGFIVGTSYYNKDNDEILLTNIQRRGKGAYFTVSKDGIDSEMTFTNFNKQYKKSRSNELPKIVLENENSVYKKSGEVFKKSSGIYTTPVSVNAAFFDELGINPTISVMNELKAIKASILAPSGYSMYYTDTNTVYTDDLTKNSFKSVLSLKILNTPENVSSVIASIGLMPSSELQQSLLNISGQGYIPAVLEDAFILGLPEIDFGIKLNLDDLKNGTIEEINIVKDKIDKGFRNIEETTLTEQNSEDNRVLNKFRVGLLAYAMNESKKGNEIISERIVLDGTKTSGMPGKKSSIPVNFNDFVEAEKKRGFIFGDPRFINGDNNIIIVSEFKFRDNNINGNIQVKTELLGSSIRRRKQLGIDIANELSLIKETNDLKKFNSLINSSTLMKYLQSNSKIIFANPIYNTIFDVSNDQYSISKYLGNQSGYIKSNIIGNNKLESDKEAFTTVGKLLLVYLNGSGKNSNWGLFDSTRAPFIKNNKNYSDFIVDYEYMHVPYSYVNSNSLLPIVDSYIKGLTAESAIKQPTRKAFGKNRRGFNYNVKTSIKDDNLDYNTSIVEAQRVISDILGDTAANEWTDFIPNLSIIDSNKRIELFGQMMNGRLQYDVQKGMVSDRTIRHEIQHLVFDNFLSSKSQIAIYNEMNDKVPGGKQMTNEEKDEWLSEWYGEHGKTYDGSRYKGLLGKFRLLLDRILGRYKMYSGELYEYLNNIETGGYKESFENQASTNNPFNETTKYSPKISDITSLDSDSFNQDNTTPDQILYKDDLSASEAMTIYLDTKKHIDRAVKSIGVNIRGYSILGSGDISVIESLSDFNDGWTNIDDITILLKNGNEVLLSELKGKDIPLLKDNDDFFEYVMYHTGINPDLRRGILKQVFPSINFNTLKSSGKSEEFSDDKQKTAKQKTSDYIKWFNSTIPLVDFAQNRLIGYIDYSQVDNILKSAGRTIKYKNDPQGDFNILINNLRSMITNDGSLKDNQVQSIIASLQDGYNFDLYEEFEEDIVGYHEPSLMDQYNRFKDSNDIRRMDEIQNFMIHYTGLIKSSINIAKDDILLGTNSNRVVVKAMNSIASQQDNMKRTLANSLYSRDQLTITQKTREKFASTIKIGNEDVFTYNIKSDGLYNGNTKVVSIINGKASFTSEGKRMNVAQQFKSLVGLNALSAKSLRAMLYHDQSMNNNPLFINKYPLTGSEYLASTLSLFSMSIKVQMIQEDLTKSFYEDNKDINSTAYENEMKVAFNDSFGKDIVALRKTLGINYKESAVESIDSEASNGLITSNAKLERPTNYFSVLNNLAELNFNNRSLASDSFVFVAGKKLQKEELRNSITNVLAREDENISSSQKINTIFESELINKGTENTPLIENDGTSNNAVINSNTIIKNLDGSISSLSSKNKPLELIIDNVSELPGIRNDYTSTSSMSRKDRSKAYLAEFMNDVSPVNNPGQFSNLVVPLGYNKRDYIVRVKAATQGEHLYGIDLTTDGRINNVIMNNEAINKALEMKFRYYYKSAKISFDNWKSFLNNTQFKSKGNVFVNFQKNFESIDLNNFKGEEFFITDEEMDLLKKNLTSQIDYYLSTSEVSIDKEYYEANIDSEKVLTKQVGEEIQYFEKRNIFGFGKALRFDTNSTAYNFTNYEIIQDEGLTTSLRNEIFNTDFVRDSKYMEELIDEKYGVEEYFNDNVPQGYETRNLYEAVNQSGDIFNNPFMEILFYTNHIANSHISPLIYSNDQLSKDIIDYTKRNNVQRTGKIELAFGHRLGLSKNGKAIIVSSNNALRTDVMANEGSIETKDGMSSGFLLHKIALMHNLGGEDFMQYDKDTMYKPVRTGANIYSTTELQIKEAIDYTSSREIEKQPRLKIMQMNLLRIYDRVINNAFEELNNQGDFVYEAPDVIARFEEIYNETNDFEGSLKTLWNNMNDFENFNFYGNVIDKVTVQNIYKESIPEGFTDESAVKRGLIGVNNTDIYDVISDEDINDIAIIDVDNTKFGMILNPGHTVDENSTVAIMNQMLSHIGVGLKEKGSKEKSISNRVDEALVSIQRIGEEQLFSEIGVPVDINNWTNEDIETFRNYLRNSSIDALMNIKGSAVLDLLNNGSSIDIPQISETIKQIFRNKYNDRVLKPRLPGVKANQSSSEAHRMYSDKNGNKYTYWGLKRIYENDDDAITNAIAANEFSESELNYMHQAEEGFVYSEIIAPYMYKNVFDIIGEDVSDVFTVITSSGDGMNIQHLVEQASLSDNPKAALTQILKDSFEGDMIDSPAVRFIVRNSDSAELFENTIEQGYASFDQLGYGKLADYFLNFNSSLEVVLSRTPYDNPALGFIAKIVSFADGVSNTVYINPLENLKTGGDFDIDQLSIYYRAFDNGNVNKDLNTINGNANELVESSLAYYKDPNNSDAIYGVTSTKNMEELVRTKEINKYNSKNELPLSTMSSAIEMAGNIQDGNDSIGIFALSSSAYSYLMQRNTKMDVGDFIYINRFTQEGVTEIRKRISRLSSFLQLALDNDKLMLLGRMNIPKRLSGTVVALVANGKTEEQIYDIFNSPALKQVINKVKTMDDIDEPAENISLLVKDTINFYQQNNLVLKTKYKDVDINSAYNQTKASLNSYLNEGQKRDLTPKEYEVIDELRIENRELGILKFADENMDILNEFYTATIYAEALRRFGQVVGLRNGLNAVDVELKLKTRNLELSLGMSIEDFVNSNYDPQNHTEQQMDYFFENSRLYKKSENKDGLEEIEREVLKALDLPNLVSRYKYFSNIIEMHQKDQQMMQSSLFVDNINWDSYEKEFAERQNRSRLDFKNELVSFNQLKSELMVDNYFQHNLDILPINISVPSVTRNMETNTPVYDNVSLRSREGRKLFHKQFPQLVKSIKNLLSSDSSNTTTVIIDYFKTIDININNNDAELILKTTFFDNIEIQGYEESERITIDSNISYDDDRIANMNSDYNLLPIELRKMFEYYSVIDSNMTYRMNSIASIINPDIYRDISKVDSNDIFKRIDEIGTEDMINYLGMNPNLAKPYNKNDEVTYVKKTKKVKNSFIDTVYLNDGRKDNTGAPILTEMVRTIMTVGYSLYSDISSWLPDIGRIKVTPEEESVLRNPESVSNRVTKSYLTGSSYKNGRTITDSGMLVNLTNSNNAGTSVILSANIGDNTQVINQIIDKAKNKTLDTRINIQNELFKSNLKKGNNFLFPLSYLEFKNNVRLNALTDNTDTSILADFIHYDKDGISYKMNIKYIGEEANNEGFNRLSTYGNYSIKEAPKGYFENSNEIKFIFEISDIDIQTRFERNFNNQLAIQNEPSCK